MSVENPSQPKVEKDPQTILYELVQQGLRDAKTIDDLAEVKRKSLAFNLDSEWGRETAQDIKKKFDELLIETTQRLITEKGHYEG